MKNTVIQGDCLEVMKGMAENSVDLIIFSPPYNKSFYDKRKKQGGINDVWKQRKIQYATFSDNLEPEKYISWQKEIITECLRVLNKKGSLFYNHKAFSHKHLLVYPKYVFDFPLKQIITWDRGSSPQINPCRFYPTTELIFWFSKTATQPYFNNKEINHKKEIWRINAKPMKEHPAPFPEELVENIILSCSKENDTILDPMAGSGTTLKMAKKNNRNYIGIEISQEYIDIINKRLSTPPSNKGGDY